MDAAKKTSLLDALTMFDRLVEQFAARGGSLTDKDKIALDKALTLHAHAAAAVKMPAGQAVPS